MWKKKVRKIDNNLSMAYPSQCILKHSGYSSVNERKHCSKLLKKGINVNEAIGS